MRSGYAISGGYDNFIWLFKRLVGENNNFVCPKYSDITIFPNGRMAYGHHQKWAKVRKRAIKKGALK